MANITSAFNAHLKAHNSVPVTHHAYNLNRIDSFLQEAYSINARIADLTRTLRSTRPAYLSTAPPARHRRHNANAHGGQTPMAHPLTRPRDRSLMRNGKPSTRNQRNSSNSSTRP